MITELGHYALILALALALVQGTLPLIGAQRGVAAWMELAPTTAAGQFVFIALAFGALTHAYVTSDFSVVNVVENSHSMKPLIYKITGVWANHEGSMLLWVLILAVFGLAVVAFGRNLPPALRARVLGVQGLIGSGFLAFLLLTSNPFLRASPAPLDGQGLNPLLQDLAMSFHPPFLYLGYVGFSITFAFAVAALIEGRVDAAWARWVRPWALAAWCFLTLGIAMGSWWAYYELGWGGWWFWDPVENASFMPWLAGTALVHSATVVEKRDGLKNWTILLAILAFSLSLIGTFLVRSGVLTSVHAFAVDPARGLFILLLLTLAIGGSLMLYALRAPALKAGGLFAPISREGGLVLNNILMATAAATVFIGTLYPLFLDAVGGGKVSVGAPYFDVTFGLLMVPALLAMAAGPLLAWKRADLAGALGRLKLAAAIVAVVVAATWSVRTDASILALFGIALAAWVVGSAVVELAERVKLFRVPLGDSLRRAGGVPRAAYGMTVAHIGVGIVVAGITASSAWRTESIQVMRPGDSVAVAGYDFAFAGAEELQGPNYTIQRGTFTVTREGRMVARLFPEQRFYTVEQRQTTEAAIHTTWLADLYAVVGDPDGTGGWVTRLYHNPLVPWLWIGAIVIALGGGLSLSDRRHRVGAPARRRRERAVPAGA